MGARLVLCCFDAEPTQPTASSCSSCWSRRHSAVTACHTHTAVQHQEGSAHPGEDDTCAHGRHLEPLSLIQSTLVERAECYSAKFMAQKLLKASTSFNPFMGVQPLVYLKACIQGTSRLRLADQSTGSDLVQGLVDDAHAGDAALQHQGLPLLPLAGLLPTGPLRYVQHCLAGRRQRDSSPLSILQGGAGLSLVQHSLTVFGPAGRQSSSCKNISAWEARF